MLKDLLRLMKKRFAELKELDSAIEQALEIDRESEKNIREEMEGTEELLNSSHFENELNEVEMENDLEATESEEIASESDIEPESEENTELEDKEWEQEEREFKGNAKKLEIDPVLGDTTEDSEVRVSITEGEREIREENKENSKQNEQEERQFKGNAKRLEIEPILDDSAEDKEVAEILKDKGGELHENPKERTTSEKEKQVEKENAKKLEIPPVLENTEEDKEVVKSLKEKEIQEKEKAKQGEQEQETKGEKISYDENYNIVREIYCELEGPISYEEISKEQEKTQESEQTKEKEVGEEKQDYIEETIEETKDQLENTSDLIPEAEEGPFEDLLYDLETDTNEGAELERVAQEVNNSDILSEQEGIEKKNEQDLHPSQLSEEKKDSEKYLEKSDIYVEEREEEKANEKKEMVKESVATEKKSLINNVPKNNDQNNDDKHQKQIEIRKDEKQIPDNEKNKALEEAIFAKKEYREDNEDQKDSPEDFPELDDIEDTQILEYEKEEREQINEAPLQDFLESTKQELRELNEEDFQEDWEKTLKEWIENLHIKEISNKEVEELLYILRKYSFLRKVYKTRDKLLKKYFKGKSTLKELVKLRVIQGLFESVSRVEKQLFINLKSFRDLYNSSHLREQALAEKEKFLLHLFTKLTYFKLLYYPPAIPPAQISNFNWAQKLKNKFTIIKDLDQKSKATIQNILSKDIISKEDEKEIIGIISLLPTETLIEIFGLVFAYHTTHYIRWGWEFYKSTKQIMLERFSNLSRIAYGRIREIKRLSQLETELESLRKEHEKIKLIEQNKGEISELFPEIKDFKNDRSKLMKEFEKKTQKNAIWRGRITKKYKNWIENKIEKINDNLQKEKLIIHFIHFSKENFK